MEAYKRTYTKPYPDGWRERPDKTTPATAQIMDNYDTAIEAIEEELVRHYSIFLLAESEAVTIDLEVDTTDYVMTLCLKTKDGVELDKKTVTIPISTAIEGLVKDTRTIVGLDLKEDITKEKFWEALNITGEDLPLESMKEGLVPDTRKIVGIALNDDITKEQLLEALDIQGAATGGSSNVDNIMDVTQEEYDALTDEEKQDGTVYNITDAPAVISEEYESERTYVEGNYSIYKNGLYKCTSSTTGEWDADCWQATTVSGELEALFMLLKGGAG
ncbi:MAG: hypothetical protein NC092_00920 [Butyrivibrio sp.]|nr:hypothetical protein [Muribaculum sp.]MCM1551234.1 hypothetical protein [Butyrivibrio sp.]